VDYIRDLGWQGVIGNTDEMHSRPESLEEFASQSSAPPSLWSAIREMAVATRAVLGEDRIAWMRGLPRVQIQDPIALVHASPESPWHSLGPEASDAELESVYSPLGQPIAISYPSFIYSEYFDYASYTANERCSLCLKSLNYRARAVSFSSAMVVPTTTMMRSRSSVVGSLGG
jgi:hypothetical protein